MKATTIASKSGAGEYGFAWESRLVQRGDKYYLVHDYFCGTGSLEGGMYRPFIFGVPSEKFGEIKKLFDDADKVITKDGLWTNWDYFTQNVIPELKSYGGASHLSWAKDL